MKKRIRRFVDGAPYHICSKGINGFCILYSFKDILVYITMYYVFAKIEGIVTDAFCIMINHTHSLARVPNVETLSAFVRNLESTYAAAYNEWHQRKGQLFKHRFGGAPKPVLKLIISCLIYIINNPVAGKICNKAIKYRWNLLAYHNNHNPFSDKLDRSRCSYKMTKALRTVDFKLSRNQYLSYYTLDEIFQDLTNNETQQLIDYIISRYQILDFQSLEKEFNGFEKALEAIEDTYGSEYDVPDDWDDYSKYESLKSLIKEWGYPQNVNFENCSHTEISQLYAALMRETGATAKQLRKFLHIRTQPL